MDTLFKALSDPARRAILDSLRTRDGQTLTELEPQFDMTRFGVMKHLKLLQDAGLIVTKKQGRFKYHYLNPLPLQEMLDRWVAPFLQPHAKHLSDLKTKLEKETSMSNPEFMMQTRIRCTQDALWTALTDADQMTVWHFMAASVRLEDDTFSYLGEDGEPFLKARTISTTPKTRIEATFEPFWEGGGHPSRSVFVIEPQDDTCLLTVEHYDLQFPVVKGEGVDAGWRDFLASLKSYLETGVAIKGAA